MELAPRVECGSDRFSPPCLLEVENTKAKSIFIDGCQLQRVSEFRCHRVVANQAEASRGLRSFRTLGGIAAKKDCYHETRICGAYGAR
jgi:hypothetical protein